MAELVTSDGEVHAVVQERWAGKTYGKHFMIVFTDELSRVAKSIKQGLTIRVLYVLPDHLNYTDFRPLPVRIVAETLDSSPGSISKAMSQLLALGVVERDGKGPMTRWRLSSDYGWNGSADAYHAFRAGKLRGKKPPADPANSPELHKGYYGNSEPCITEANPAPCRPKPAQSPPVTAAAAMPNPCPDPYA